MPRRRTPLLLLALFPVGRAPNTYHPTQAIWSTLKRCDVLGSTNSGFGFYHNSPYTEGHWVPASAGRPSIAASVPRFCAAGTTACPQGTCAAGSQQPTEVCTSHSNTCYGSITGGEIIGRPTRTTYTQFVKGLSYVWQPRDSCHFSPLATASVHGDVLSDAWRTWAQGLEQDGGPMMWVGDGLLAEQCAARPPTFSPFPDLSLCMSRLHLCVVKLTASCLIYCVTRGRAGSSPSSSSPTARRTRTSTAPTSS